MKIATWNINSIRIRIEAIKAFLLEKPVDVLCFQETKVENSLFPKNEIASLGFEHIVFDGEKSYNGVAIASKFPFDSHRIIKLTQKSHTRHIAVKLAGFDFELHNFYIPAGGDIPDPLINEKFKHKLDYLDEMLDLFKKSHNSSEKIILVGDLNIAPFENDVWSHRALINEVSHTPIETEKLINIQKSINFIDVGRHFIPLSEKLYSWWSYRNRDWKKSNRGRRLDHIWVTEPLARNLKSYEVFSLTRDYKSTSDHVPVIVELA